MHLYKKKFKNRGLKCLPDIVQFIVIKPLNASNSENLYLSQINQVSNNFIYFLIICILLTD